jgi:hypothetical protein
MSTEPKTQKEAFTDGALNGALNGNTVDTKISPDTLDDNNVKVDITPDTDDNDVQLYFCSCCIFSCFNYPN